MSGQSYTIVIPARYASSRFPGKPLHLLNGKPMILHTIARAQESAAESVIVATDDERIRAVCVEAGVDVQMTDPDHPSGTDRIAEVARVRNWDQGRVIVGLQGDEPATPAHHLDLLAGNLERVAEADMATLCMPIQNVQDYRDANRVKVVRDKRDMALYFSRASIPVRRDLSVTDDGAADSFPAAFLHIGLYAYRCGYLLDYHELKACTLELEEQLEQLRVLYHGGRIHVGEVEASSARGIDHPDDVAVLEPLLASQFEMH
ncbi:3-deoxy-manno-octulosonate cytidylyltransferase [Granulosicoccus antarcticus]|uniref:3-deoxy-manno-octulosonate cytidylyltransferase n=1 Tax=Granulosicoccus antarcticus IMCC3135 TaxID=1192854 RepID=A0A2Z2NU40_9GAMM|nr:3-deoxy-manno-octulosonate cytidylyltransferase [Granulosicoccus antarcticus]ASJ75006.1 3-deoxy-manno-octulosonate cytidylyltransferase [Granulosicoccus antarcticus IMCC3135]